MIHRAAICFGVILLSVGFVCAFPPVEFLLYLADFFYPLEEGYYYKIVPHQDFGWEGVCLFFFGTFLVLFGVGELRKKRVLGKTLK